MKDEDNYHVDVEHSAVFSNFIGFKKRILELPQGKNIIIDFSNTRLIDHTVMENLHEIQNNYRRMGGTFEIVGLDEHAPLSTHPFASRKTGKKA